MAGRAREDSQGLVPVRFVQVSGSPRRLQRVARSPRRPGLVGARSCSGLPGGRVCLGDPCRGRPFHAAVPSRARAFGVHGPAWSLILWPTQSAARPGLAAVRSATADAAVWLRLCRVRPSGLVPGSCPTLRGCCFACVLYTPARFDASGRGGPARNLAGVRGPVGAGPYEGRGSHGAEGGMSHPRPCDLATRRPGDFAPPQPCVPACLRLGFRVRSWVWGWGWGCRTRACRSRPWGRGPARCRCTGAGSWRTAGCRGGRARAAGR